MRKSNIALYLRKLRPDGLEALMRNVVAKMTGNATFATPVVKLVDITAKADALELAIEAATGGSRQSKLLRNDLVAESRVMLTAQADYVRGICNGDPTLLDSSGFPLARPIAPLPPPAPPVGLEVTRTTVAGVLKVRWRKDRGALLYYLEMLVEGSTEWTRIRSTSRVKHEITGLITGTEYSFRVQVTTATGVSPMSETVTAKAA